MLLAVAVASCVAQECAFGHQRIGERCYSVHTSLEGYGLSWENAQLNCQSYGGGHLAHIESYEVFDELGPVLHELNKRTNRLVWVGARSVEGTWLWENGIRVEIEDVENHPGLGDCLALRSDIYFSPLHGEDCSQPGAWVCEYPQ